MDVEGQDPHGSDDGPLDRLNPFRKTDERKKHWGYSACDFTDYISSRLSFFSFADRVYTRLLRYRLLLRGTRWMKGVRARSIETETMKSLGIIDIYQRTDVSVIGTERERNATRDAYRTESFVDSCNLVAVTRRAPTNVIATERYLDLRLITLNKRWNPRNVNGSLIGGRSLSRFLVANFSISIGKMLRKWYRSPYEINRYW